MAAIVERWNPHARVRVDLFSFIDILAVRGDEVLAVQACAGASVAARVTKAKAAPTYTTWLQSPHRRFEVHGWALRGERLKRKLWTVRRVDGRTLENIE